MNGHIAALKKDIVALEAGLAKMRSALRALEGTPTSTGHVASNGTITLPNAILSILPHDAETPVQMKWLLRRLKSSHKLRPKRSAAQRALLSLVQSGQIRRHGAGRATCYWIEP